MPDRVDAVVVGAGVIGLAVARALARGGRETVVLEAADGIGTGTSSRNSEVVHAGIYYPAGSLKARHCIEGRRRLYRFCDEFGVGYRRCGKLIVATSDSDAAVLRALQVSALANGLTGDDALVPLSPAEVRRLEPELACTAALLSPATGIVHSHALMLALLGDAEGHGTMVAFRSPLLSAEVVRGGFHLVVGGPGGEAELAAGALVNAAGLDAPAVARRIAGLAPRHVPAQHLAKGSYFGLSGRPPFERLVYPVPVPGGLGVHATLDLAGRVRFGPDVEWVDRADYAVDPRRAGSFYEAIRRYWPGLPDGALSPDYSGIRPKLAASGAPASDFRLDGPAAHGVPGLVNLFGIDSPGLTASLSLAEAVLDALGLPSRA